MKECIHRGLCPNECPCDYYEEQKDEDDRESD